MGVKHLWRLFPKKIEIPANKRLAIDVSIWLHYYKNIDLPSFKFYTIRRILKLLYTKNKPVFVFDNKIPDLKKKAIISRQKSQQNLALLARKYLSNKMCPKCRLPYKICEHATVLLENKIEQADQQQIETILREKPKVWGKFYDDELKRLENSDFLEKTVSQKLNVLIGLREKRKLPVRMRQDLTPEDFSSAQIANLKKRNKVNELILDLDRQNCKRVMSDCDRLIKIYDTAGVTNLNKKDIKVKSSRKTEKMGRKDKIKHRERLKRVDFDFLEEEGPKIKHFDPLDAIFDENTSTSNDILEDSADLLNLKTGQQLITSKIENEACKNTKIINEGSINQNKWKVVSNIKCKTASCNDFDFLTPFNSETYEQNYFQNMCDEHFDQEFTEDSISDETFIAEGRKENLNGDSEENQTNSEFSVKKTPFLEFKENEILDEIFCENQEDFVENKKDFVDNQKDFVENKKDFVDNQKDFVENKKDFVDNQKDFIENKKDFVDNQKDFVENKKDFVDNQKDFVENQQDFVDNQKDFVENEKDLLENTKTENPLTNDGTFKTSICDTDKIYSKNIYFKRVLDRKAKSTDKVNTSSKSNNEIQGYDQIYGKYGLDKFDHDLLSRHNNFALKEAYKTYSESEDAIGIGKNSVDILKNKENVYITNGSDSEHTNIMHIRDSRQLYEYSVSYQDCPKAIKTHDIVETSIKPSENFTVTNLKAISQGSLFPIDESETQILTNRDEYAEILTEKNCLNRNKNDVFLKKPTEDHFSVSLETNKLLSINPSNKDVLHAKNKQILTKQDLQTIYASEQLPEIQNLTKIIKEILTAFNLPFIDAVLEADSQCAYLNKQNLVDAVVTEDNDIFLYGGTKIYRNYFKKNKHIELYDIKKLDEKYTIDDLIFMSMLLGSDYTDGVNGYGLKRSIQYLTRKRLKENGVITEDTFEDNIVDPFLLNQVRNLYHNAAVKEIDEIEWKPIDKDKIVRYLGENEMLNSHVKEIMFHLSKL